MKNTILILLALIFVACGGENFTTTDNENMEWDPTYVSDGGSGGEGIEDTGSEDASGGSDALGTGGSSDSGGSLAVGTGGDEPQGSGGVAGGTGGSDAGSGGTTSTNPALRFQFVYAWHEDGGLAYYHLGSVDGALDTTLMGQSHMCTEGGSTKEFCHSQTGSLLIDGAYWGQTLLYLLDADQMPIKSILLPTDGFTPSGVSTAEYVTISDGWYLFYDATVL